MRVSKASRLALAVTVSAVALSGCGGGSRTGHVLPPADLRRRTAPRTRSARITSSARSTSSPSSSGATPSWAPSVQVRPDGRITTPLIADMVAVGKTPAQLADDIRQALTQYINDRWSR